MYLNNDLNKKPFIGKLHAHWRGTFLWSICEHMIYEKIGFLQEVFLGYLLQLSIQNMLRKLMLRR